jgi:hypothetical protein
MPRRNRNANARRIDADDLAAHAKWLEDVLAINNAFIPVIPGIGKSAALRRYLITYLEQHSGCQLSYFDPKGVTGNGRI